MASIRRQYGVPAKRGARVRFAGYLATITSADRSHAWLHLLADNGERFLVHPTWEMEYLPPEAAA